MKGVVLLRGVLDREAQPAKGRVVLDGPSVVALGQAVEWRRTAHTSLTGVAVGPQSWETALRDALALGLDTADLVVTDDEGEVEVARTAAALAGVIGLDQQIVFAGSAASDSGSGAVPAALAGILDWPLLSNVVWARQMDDVLQAEAIGGPGRRKAYEIRGPCVMAAARLALPPLYPPLARRLAAARAQIGHSEPDFDGAGLPPRPRIEFLGYGPGRPRTRYLLKPSAAAKPGDRLSQLMYGGVTRSGSKLDGDAGDLAKQLAALLEDSGFLSE